MKNPLVKTLALQSLNDILTRRSNVQKPKLQKKMIKAVKNWRKKKWRFVKNKRNQLQFKFNLKRKKESSIHRELLAISCALKSFSTLFENKIVNWKTDNLAASVICEKGTSKVNLQNLSENIYFNETV